MNNEPVAWMTENGTIFDELPPILGGLIPLYTHPAKKLTDEEIIKEINSLATGWFSDKFEKGLFITEEAMVNLIQSVLRKAQEK